MKFVVSLLRTIAASLAIITTLRAEQSACDLIDPGRMFESPTDQEVDPHVSAFPSLWSQPLDSSWISDNNSCSTGSSTVLKRIVKKLFNHVDLLQPRYLNDDQLDCAKLHKLDMLLSNFISSAEVKRPTQSSIPFSFDFFTYPSYGFRDLNNYMLKTCIVILIFVLMLMKVGFGHWKSWTSVIMLIGFFEYWGDQIRLTIDGHQEKLEVCSTSSYLGQVFASLGYDYDQCKGLTFTYPPVSVVFVDYIALVIFHPLNQVASILGTASQSYLNGYSGWWKFLAPVFLALIYILAFYAIPKFLLTLFTSSRRGNNRSTASRSSSRNALSGNNPKRKSIKNSANSPGKIKHG